MMKRTYYSAIIFFHVLLAYSVEPDVQKMEAGSSTVQSESKTGAPVTLDVKPVNGADFTFGEFSEVAFTLKNVSDRYIVILSIQPLRNPGETGKRDDSVTLEKVRKVCELRRV